MYMRLVNLPTCYEVDTMVRNTTFTTWFGSLVPETAFVCIAGVFLLRKVFLKQKEHVNDGWKEPQNPQNHRVVMIQ